MTTPGQPTSREEDLLRAAVERHAADIDEPVSYVRTAPRRNPAPWIAGGVAVALLAGGGIWWATLPDTPTATVATPAATTWSTPTRTPSPDDTPTQGETPVAQPSATTSAVETPMATPTVVAPAVPVSSSAVASTTPSASVAPGFTPNASGAENGDYNPTDPTPKPADRLLVSTPVTTKGWGSYVLGTSGKDLVAKGLIVPDKGACQGSWAPITAHRTLGLRTTRVTSKGLVELEVANPAVHTDKGASTGMTVAQVQKLYGKALTLVPEKSQAGKPLVMARVLEGADEIVFVTTDDRGQDVAASPGAKVSALVIRPVGTTLPNQDAC